MVVYSYNTSNPSEFPEKLDEIGRDDPLFDVPIDVVAGKSMVLKFGVG